MTNCQFCGEEFTPTARDFQYVSGWMQTRRTKGGPNAVTKPFYHDRWAHADCVKLPGQKALLLEEAE